MGQPRRWLSNDRDSDSEGYLQQKQVSRCERQGVADAAGDQGAIGREDAILRGAGRILQRVHKRLPPESSQWKEFASRVPGNAEGYVHAVQAEVQDDGQVFCVEVAREGRADGSRSGVEPDGDEERDFRDKPDGAQRCIRRAL